MNRSRVETNGQVFVMLDSLLIVESSLRDEGFYYCNLSSPAGPPRLSPTIFLDVLSESFATHFLAEEGHFPGKRIL